MQRERCAQLLYLPWATIVLIAVMLGWAGTASAQMQLDLSGTWRGTWQSIVDPDFDGRFEVRFVQSGQRLTGSITVDGSPMISRGTVEGTIEGNQVRFGVVTGGSAPVNFTGMFTARTGSGNYIAGTDRGTWSASR